MFGDDSTGGTRPIAKSGGEWRSLLMEAVLTAILVSIILKAVTGHRTIGHNAAIAVGRQSDCWVCSRAALAARP